MKANWWLPATPEHPIEGQLIFSPENSTEIVLQGILHDPPYKIPSSFIVPLIYGKLYSGEFCSVFEAFEASLDPVKNTSKLIYNKMLVGPKPVESENTTFSYATVEMTGLQEWLHISGLRQKFPIGDLPEPYIPIEYKQPRELRFRVDTLNATLSFKSSLSQMSKFSKCELSERAWLKIKPKRKQNIFWFNDTIFKFRILLSLLVGEPMEILSIRLYNKIRTAQSGKVKYVNSKYDYCFQQYGRKSSKEQDVHRMPFPYHKLRLSFYKLINNWYIKSDQLKSVYELYFGVIVNESAPMEFIFLSLLQAIESYYRETHKNSYMSKKDYKKVKEDLVKAIPTAISESFKEALKSRLQYGYEYSNRKRLTILINKIPASIRELITGNDPQFVDKIVRTRNYIVHRDRSDMKNVLEFRELIVACERLKFLLNYLLLNEMEIPSNLIEEVFLHDPRFRFHDPEVF